jgi:hypothetical protein
MLTARSIARAVQWIAAGGVSVVVLVTTCWTTEAAASGLRPGGRVLSHNRPATPSAAKRACQRQTVGFDCPVRRMISIVPMPSPRSTANFGGEQ